MTHWRDARLEQALAHAPDDGLRPAEAVRAAVLESAHRAVAGKAAATVSAPFWRRAWTAMGRSGQPWNAAFATIVLACLVTVLWWDKPVPEAAVDSPPFKAPKTQATRPAAPADASVAAERPRPAPELEKKEKTEPRQARQTPAAPAPAAPPAAAAATGATGPALSSPAAQPAPAESRADAAAGERERSKATAAAAAPAPFSPPAPVTAMAPLPAPAAAPPALRREAAPAARDMAESSNRAAAAGGMAGLSAAQAPNAATRAPEPLTLTLEGRALSFTAAQAQRIESLVQVLAAQANSSEPLQSRVVAQVQRLRDPASAGTLQLAPPQVRWQPVRPGAQALTGRPDAAQLQALLEALQQLPER